MANHHLRTPKHADQLDDLLSQLDARRLNTVHATALTGLQFYTSLNGRGTAVLIDTEAPLYLAP